MVHEIECRHQVEVEVWPASATAYFQDERFVNPIDTQVRFDAAIYNSPYWVTWEVKSLAGGPGAGTIDPSGLYTAPPKGTYPHGLTDLIVATTVEAPHRQAYARVTLIGFGPAPQPVSRLQIFPKQAYIYASLEASALNTFIDQSNRQQRFVASIHNLPLGASPQIKWQVVGFGLSATDTDFFLVKSSDLPAAQSDVFVTATLGAPYDITDTARIYLLNYAWPGYDPESVKD